MFESTPPVRPPRRVAADRMPSGPPGWPKGVPPPGAPRWIATATGWLLDHCPADYRARHAWRRHPEALAWVAVRHLDAQLVAMRQAYRDARVELADLDPNGLREVLADLEVEGLRLLDARRSAALILEALNGGEFVPRL